MRPVRWPARSRGLPAEAARRRARGCGRGVHAPDQSLLLGGGMPPSRHAAVGSVSRTSRVPRRRDRARRRDRGRRAGSECVGDPPRNRDTTPHGGPMAVVVARCADLERGIRRCRGAVRAGARRESPPAVVAREVHGRQRRRSDRRGDAVAVAVVLRGVDAIVISEGRRATRRGWRSRIASTFS